MKIIPSFLIMAMVLFAGCGPRNGEIPKNPYYDEIYHSTTGIRHEFSSQIDTAIEDKRLVSSIVFDNKGPYDTTVTFVATVNTQDMVFIEGGGQKASQVASIGRTVDAPFPAPVSVPFAMNIYPLYDGDSKTTEAVFNYCYDYYGELSTNFCLDRDPENLALVSDKDCQIQPSLSFDSGQGGPVAIEKIEYSVLTGTDGSILPSFKIFFNNKGQGDIWRYGRSADACYGRGLGENDFNAIDIEGMSFPGYTLSDFDCGTLPYVLKDPDKEEGYFKRALTCTLREGRLSRMSYSTPTNLNIKFRYGYKVSIPKSIKIEKNR